MTIELSLPVEFGNFLTHFLNLDADLCVTPKCIVNDELKLEVESSEVQLTLVKIVLYLQLYKFIKEAHPLITLYYVREFTTTRR